MKTIEQSFSDWEGNAFGFGYGTGEPHTVPALRRFFELCNRNPNGQYDYAVLERELTPAVAWFVISALCRHGVDMIEYGTSPRYGWLTYKGQALQRFMLSRTDDELIRLACGAAYPDGDENCCYPDTCNCGPRGYEKGRICINPFWQDDAARTFLANDPSKERGDG